jgi:hypothetical protein
LTADDEHFSDNGRIDYDAAFDPDKIPDLDSGNLEDYKIIQQYGHQQPQLQQPQLKKLTREMRRLDGDFKPIATTAY